MWFNWPFPKADEVEHIFYMSVLYRYLYFFFCKIPISFLGSSFCFVAYLFIDLEKLVLYSINESFLSDMFC